MASEISIVGAVAVDYSVQNTDSIITSAETDTYKSELTDQIDISIEAQRRADYASYEVYLDEQTAQELQQNQEAQTSNQQAATNISAVNLLI